MRRRVALISLAVLLVLIGIFAIVLSRQRLRRHRVFHTAPAEKPPAPPTAQVGPVGQWTDQFREMEISGRWAALDELLERIQKSHADLYGRYQLAYKRGVMGGTLGSNTVRITISPDVVANPPNIPARYNTESELTKEVKSGQNEFNFDLTTNEK